MSWVGCWRRTLVATVLWSVVWIAGAQAAPTYKSMQFAESGTSLVVTTTFTDLFNEAAFRNLSTGFPTTVSVRLLVFKKGQEEPVAATVVILQVVYDLWEEVYVLRRRDITGVTTKKMQSRVEVLREMTELYRQPIAKRKDVSIGPHYFLDLAVDLNPIEDEALAEMRHWLTKSASETRLDTSSSFFGTFVSVFANPKLSRADRMLRLRSQPFYRGSR